MTALSPFAVLRAAFDEHTCADDGGAALLTFTGADGYDVFNCSAPFLWEGKLHVFGRVERRDEVAESHSRIFVATDKENVFSLLEEPISRQLEDPFVAVVDGDFVFGGVQIVKDVGKIANHYCDFYRGPTPERPVYFSTGADGLSQIRVVQLADGKIGFFAQLPAGASKGAGIGFATVATLLDVSRASTARVEPIEECEEMMGAWGAVDHPYLLTSGKIGCLSHHALEGSGGDGCCATSFVYDPATNTASDFKILATKDCFPSCPSKPSHPEGCAMASGIAMRDDMKGDLYVALGQTSEGRMTVDYPFEGHGEIASKLVF